MGAHDGTVTRWTRVALLGQVVAMLALVLAGVLLVIEVAQSPGTRARVDVTYTQSSSLDPATAAVLEGLPERAEVDIFYRPPAIGAEALSVAMAQMRALLDLAQEQVPGSLSVRFHDANALAATRSRMEEIRVTADDLTFGTPVGSWLASMVVKVGDRRTVAHFVPDICFITLGNPDEGIPARIERWMGEQALAEALGRVSGARPPVVAFSMGTAELPPDPGAQGGFGDFAQALVNEGFEVVAWDPSQEPAVPESVDVLVLAGPDNAFQPATAEAIEAFVFAGGALFASQGRERYVPLNGLPALLERFGMRIEDGLICRPIHNPMLRDDVTGYTECAIHSVIPANLNRTHPVTESLIRGSDVVGRFTNSLGVRRGQVPGGGTFVDLVYTSDKAWRDLPVRTPNGVFFDYDFDSSRERFQRHTLMAATQWDTPEGERVRVVALGSPEPISTEFEFNRDLMLNSIEWLAERDNRVRLRPRVDFDARIPPDRTGLASAVHWTGWLGFPAVCVVLAGLLARSRRRS